MRSLASLAGAGFVLATVWLINFRLVALNHPVLLAAGIVASELSVVLPFAQVGDARSNGCDKSRSAPPARLKNKLANLGQRKHCAAPAEHLGARKKLAHTYFSPERRSGRPLSRFRYCASGCRKSGHSPDIRPIKPLRLAPCGPALGPNSEVSSEPRRGLEKDACPSKCRRRAICIRRGLFGSLSGRRREELRDLRGKSQFSA